MKKIPTMFVRDFSRDNGRYVTEELTPGCEWVAEGLGFATRKWDGACVWLDGDGWLWARREVKPGKPTPGFYVPLETDSATGKTVGWEPAYRSSFAKVLATIDTTGLEPGTYELVGPKVNGNPELAAAHELWRHGSQRVSAPDRSYTGVRSLLLSCPDMEGLVFWRELGNPDAGLAKIKRRDFREDTA